MSQIFDIVEELEKERKKNKVLIEEVLKYEISSKEKQNRIDKAIEYIKKRTTDEETGEYLGYPDMIDDEYLLNILKGDNNE